MFSKKKTDPLAALRIRPFRLFIASRFCITSAMQMQAVVVGWQVYDITQDPFSLGLIGLAEAIPSISVSLFGGHLADIKDRKSILLAGMVVIMLCSAALLSFVLFPLPTESVLVYVYSVIFVSGLARGFMYPAISSILATIVPKDLYANSSTWNSATWQLAAVSGPAIGGLLYGFAGIEFAYLIDVCLLICGFLLILRVPYTTPVNTMPRERILRSLQSGLKFVFGHQLILAAISLDLFAVLFGGAVALLPYFAKEILDVGPEGLGILRAAPAMGAIVMAFFLAYYPPLEKTGKILLASVAMFGVCTICFALSTSFYISLALLFLAGLFDNVSVVVRSTIIQTYTPDHMRGRVASVNAMFIGSSNEIGAFESGSAARLLGVIPSVIFGGSVTLLVVAITSLVAKRLRLLDLKKRGSDPSVDDSTLSGA